MNIYDFSNTELLEAVHPHAVEIFPEMEFEPYAKGWRSRLHLDGTVSHSKDQTTYNAAAPYCFSDWNGSTISVISYVRDRDKLSWIEAVKYLAQKAGVDLPKWEPTNVAQYERRQTQAEQLNKFVHAARLRLHLPEGTDALLYLQNERRYDLNFINFAEIGYVDGTAIDELKKIVGYGSPDYKGSKTLDFSTLGKEHSLVFPFHNRGRLLGLVFRAIVDAEPKYLDLFPDKEEAKAAHFFGLNGVRINNEHNDLVIVEGEFDALRAQHKGFRNVVAASGGAVGEKALQEVKRMGVKNITILFDNEGKDNAEGQEKTYLKVEKAIRNIQKADMIPYVSFLPSGADGCKVDADSYFQTHTAEQFADVIKSSNTFSANRYFYQRAADRYKADVAKYGTDAEKPLRSFVERIYDIWTDNATQAYERDYIAKDADILTGGLVTAAAIEAQAGALKVTRDAQRQREEIIRLTRTAAEQAQKGDNASAIATLDKLTAVKALDRSALFAQMDRKETREERKRRRQQQPEALPTCYSFEGSTADENGSRMRPFTLPRKALTFVGAQTSHGKSRFLQNLVIDQARRTEGVNIYVSLEEDYTDVERELLNIYAGIPLATDRTLDAIKAYQTNGTERFFSRKAKEQGAVEAFKRAEAEFENLLDAERIKILDTSSPVRDVETLCGYIRHAATTCNLNAVFIDYVQLIAGGKAWDKKNELEQICAALMDVSKETGTAIVCAAQLNRTAKSPTEMSCQNLADASNLEHCANTVVLLWNSKEKATADSADYENGTEPKRDKKGNFCSKDAADLHNRRQFYLNNGGKLYAVLAKNRGGERGISAVFDFDQNTGVIHSQNTGKFCHAPQGTTRQPSKQINNNHLLK